MADRAINMPGTGCCQLLTPNERAERDGSTDPQGCSPDATSSWHSHSTGRILPGAEPIDHAGVSAVAGSRGFAPKAAIATGSQTYPTSEAEPAVRIRLRALPLVYLLILAMATSWRCALLGDEDVVLHYLDGTVIAALGGVLALLWSRWPVSLAWLRVLELGMVSLIASRVTIVQYRLMLTFSLRDDPMMAQLILKNIVLLTSILILICGLHVPKTWRRAALMAGTLALLPFATLSVLYVGHSEVMGWLGRGSEKGDTPPIVLFSFDAMVLLILAVGSAFGGHAISRLRRQVAVARQLGQYRL
jgi:serine/threonine-protein kinase